MPCSLSNIIIIFIPQVVKIPGVNYYYYYSFITQQVQTQSKICTQKSLKHKNCSINYDKCTLHANVAPVARLTILTEKYGFLSSTCDAVLNRPNYNTPQEVTSMFKERHYCVLMYFYKMPVYAHN